MNGFHDAANSIATIVSTRVLSPQWAVIWAAFFNFIAFLFFGLSVANTIGKGVIDPAIIDSSIIFSALVGAIIWNVITWYYGIPSSSSHALIGSLGGAAVAKAGVSALTVSGFTKIGLSIFLSPIIGFFWPLFYDIVSILFFKSNPMKVDSWGRRMQLVSAGMYSLGHGGNDAQKTMGIIAVLLYSTGYMKGDFHVSFVDCFILSCGHGTWYPFWWLENC